MHIAKLVIREGDEEPTNQEYRITTIQLGKLSRAEMMSHKIRSCHDGGKDVDG